jgi:arginyl-tRNA synthetase
MSKRSGDFITIRELVDEVGSDSIRFMMLYRKNEAPLEFNFQKVTEQSKDNPVFYVQYAHARICSVIRNLKECKLDLDLNTFDNCNYEQLREDGELFLLKKIMNYSSIIETSATLEEPHRISYYLYDLASALHSLWNQGKIDKEKRFIDENNIERTYARIALLMLTKRTLKSGLDILGVSAPEEMQ